MQWFPLLDTQAMRIKFESQALASFNKIKISQNDDFFYYQSLREIIKSKRKGHRSNNAQSSISLLRASIRWASFNLYVTQTLSIKTLLVAPSPLDLRSTPSCANAGCLSQVSHCLNGGVL